MSQSGVSFYAPILLGLASLTAGPAQAASVRVQPEMSFFEYLGSMVEDDDGWVDPLQMEDPDFFSGAASEQAVQAGQNEQMEQTAAEAELETAVEEQK